MQQVRIAGTVADAMAAPGACARPRHIGVVVQRHDQVDAALEQAVRIADGHCLRLSIIGIAVQRPIINHLAPLSGAVSYEQLMAEAESDAACAARLAALGAPACACVTYRCVEGWRVPWLLNGLRQGDFNALVLGARPERRSDRRRVAAAAREGIVTLVLAGSGRGSPPVAPASAPVAGAMLAARP